MKLLIHFHILINDAAIQMNGYGHDECIYTFKGEGLLIVDQSQLLNTLFRKHIIAPQYLKYANNPSQK